MWNRKLDLNWLAYAWWRIKKLSKLFDFIWIRRYNCVFALHNGQTLCRHSSLCSVGGGTELSHRRVNQSFFGVWRIRANYIFSDAEEFESLLISSQLLSTWEKKDSMHPIYRKNALFTFSFFDWGNPVFPPPFSLCWSLRILKSAFSQTNIIRVCTQVYSDDKWILESLPFFRTFVSVQFIIILFLFSCFAHYVFSIEWRGRNREREREKLRSDDRRCCCFWWFRRRWQMEKATRKSAKLSEHTVWIKYVERG